MKGKLEFDADKYHCPRYNDLIKNVINLRVQYYKTKDIEGR